jgi:biotin transport system substrate-specific component
MKQNSLYSLTACALVAAVLCVLGPMSLPIGPVPISLTNLVLFVAVYLLGAKGAAVSTLVYLLLGAVGMPVFSGYEGGLGKLAGPTGGYLIGFVFLSLICGAVVERFYDRPLLCIAGMIAGDLTLFVFGTAWFVLEMKCQVWYALTVCVFPFLPFDLIKMVIAAFLGKGVRSALEKSGLLPQEA